MFPNNIHNKATADTGSEEKVEQHIITNTLSIITPIICRTPTKERIPINFDPPSLAAKLLNKELNLITYPRPLIGEIARDTKRMENGQPQTRSIINIDNSPVNPSINLVTQELTYNTPQTLSQVKRWTTRTTIAVVPVGHVKLFHYSV